MNLGRIQSRIYSRTNTGSSDWGSSGADMVDALNNANERLLSLIRDKTDNFYPTAWTTTDLSTGTAVPVIDALFHDLYVLWPSFQYQADKNKRSVALLWSELQDKEKQLLAFYSARQYRIFTLTIADPGVFTRKTHKLSAGDRVIFSTSGALPTGLSVNTWYYVISQGLTEDEFQVSATKTGSAITTTGSQSGTHTYAADIQQPARLQARVDNMR